MAIFWNFPQEKADVLPLLASSLSCQEKMVKWTKTLPVSCLEHTSVLCQAGLTWSYLEAGEWRALLLMQGAPLIKMQMMSSGGEVDSALNEYRSVLHLIVGSHQHSWRAWRPASVCVLLALL